MNQPYLIIPLVFFVLGLAFLFIKLQQAYQRANLLRVNLLKFDDDLLEMERVAKDSSEFLRYSKLNSIQKTLENLKCQVLAVKNVFLRKESAKLLAKIESLQSNLPRIREQTNRQFFIQEKERARSIFTDTYGKPLLTDEQLEAVLCNDNRNLVVAGAGSGKTRVIDFKVRYLVNYKKVSPQKILLLSFSKKSAGDLTAKISKNVPGITSKTIHSFSFHNCDRKDRKLFDENKNEMANFVIRALVETLREKDIFQHFQTFYEKFFSDLKPLIFYKSLNDLRADLKKINSKLINFPDLFGEIKARRALKTLRGEYVRSVDERYIADFLYLQNIDYEYEPKYTAIGSSYYPDFYLKDYQIYLEHFAITSSGQPPPYFDNPQKYLNGIVWKRRIHQQNKTKMIESYSYLLNKRGSSDYLSELLTHAGIPIRDLTMDETIFNKISRNFAKIFTKFYNSFKLSGLSISELKQNNTADGNRLFLAIFERFLFHFEELVKNENKMDFNDMLIEAITNIQNIDTRSYDYIIIDEFQDTSILAMKLLDVIFQSNPNATLLAVGDDWQSIYGFNGSDVTIFSNYNKRYEGVSERVLNSNFRSHAKVVDLGKEFITRNPAQRKKSVISQNSSFGASEVDFISFELMEQKILALPDNETIFVLYRYNEDCPALRGIFQNYFYLDKHRKPVRKSHQSKKISLMSLHASKGLEAQHVFILFPDGIKRKFPSEIEDHFVFNMLKTSEDNFQFSEERRLMYVGITRAEQNLYFVSPNKDPNSVFWDELAELNKHIG